MQTDQPTGTTGTAASITLTAETFAREIEQAPGLALVDFWAPWCGPCHMVSPIVEQLAREHAGRVKVGKVNTDAEPGLGARFGIRSLPTVVLFRDGSPVDAVVGAYPRQVYEQKIAAHG
ncbi:MAG TPA: thioredoxin [Gemmatimonadales bacterium]|nr:thioredoxin [Gemmatimonadales bacterium]